MFPEYTARVEQSCLFFAVTPLPTLGEKLTRSKTQTFKLTPILNCAAVDDSEQLKTFGNVHVALKNLVRTLN